MNIESDTGRDLNLTTLVTLSVNSVSAFPEKRASFFELLTQHTTTSLSLSLPFSFSFAIVHGVSQVFLSLHFHVLGLLPLLLLLQSQYYRHKVIVPFTLHFL